MQHFEVDFYKTPDGFCPIEEFLDSLEMKMQAKALRAVLLLEQNGNELREPYSKHLKDGIFELRVKQGSDIIRLLYFFVVRQKIILTNGFVKKTLRTPKRELELALKYCQDYLSREEKKHE